MKRILTVLFTILLVGAFAAFALASGESENIDTDQGKGTVENAEENKNALGDFDLEIQSCRLAKDYEGKDVVIIKYVFTNNGDDAEAFYTAFDDNVYQNGVGLNGSYVVDDAYNYSSDNQTKEIQKGATLEVEVAYELNDTTTDINVEVSELISFEDKKITKTFSLNQ